MGLLFNIIKKKIEEKQNKTGVRNDIDKSLPDNLKFNSIVNVDSSLFLVYEDELKVKHPGKDSLVKAIGVVEQELDDDADWYHIYLDNQGKESLLQIVMSGEEIVDCKFYTVLDEVYPQDEEDWDFWINEEDGSIGLPEFQTKDGKIYSRLWVDSDKRVFPFSAQETVYISSYDHNPIEVRNGLMLYGRHIDEDNMEYVLLSLDETGDEAFIKIMVGVDINTMSI